MARKKTPLFQPGGYAATEERRLRLLEAEKHPDETDLRTAGETFRAFWE